ncbi:MAG: peptidoglycan DD-metalloendopeptidase family protein [Proteobacteria bacterium]|nr:peptidoglycan DD-metalloendopeptidase family protein [Pseudomonadota bacterium]
MIAADNKAIGAARVVAERHDEKQYGDFAKPFLLPVKGGVTSGVFGSRRTYNGEEHSWHRGHDLAAPRGTEVRAPAAGVVRLARMTFLTGNLLMLDHGAGVTSVYAHLAKMNVKVGDKVVAGQVIGRVGTTGRSTGPHLHWGMYWQNHPIDPILWVKAPPQGAVHGEE